MTENADPGPAAQPEAGTPRRTIVRAVLRASGSTIALVAIYYLLPLDHSSTWVAVTILVIGLVLLLGLVAFQVRKIVTSPFPGLRGVEALAISIPLFLLLFASTYVVMDTISASNFTEPLTRTDALYFTVTVFSTVGFGDITAKTEAARLVVTGQMIADLVVIGLGLKVIVGAVKRGRQRGPTGAVAAHGPTSRPPRAAQADRPLQAGDHLVTDQTWSKHGAPRRSVQGSWLDA